MVTMENISWYVCLAKKSIYPVIVIASLSSCASANKDIGSKYRDDEQCSVTMILDSYNNSIKHDIAELLTLDAVSISQEIDNDLLFNIHNVQNCAVLLSANQLENGEPVAACDVFKLSVTFDGLLTVLNEINECKTGGCDSERTLENKEVISLQKERLDMLTEQCSR